MCFFLRGKAWIKFWLWSAMHSIWYCGHSRTVNLCPYVFVPVATYVQAQWLLFFCLHRDHYRQTNKDNWIWNTHHSMSESYRTTVFVSITLSLQQPSNALYCSQDKEWSWKEESIALKCVTLPLTPLSFSVAYFASCCLSWGKYVDWYPLGSWLRLYSESGITGIYTDCTSDWEES